MQVKITHFSDTYGLHAQLKVPLDSDIIICTGNIHPNAKLHDVRWFFKWFSALPGSYKIFVPGPRDRWVDSKLNDDGFNMQIAQVIGEFFPINGRNHILINNGVKLAGLNFYGSPTSASVTDFDSSYWAYTKDKSPLISDWSKIPMYTDVLCTNTAPLGILDKTSFGSQLGCSYLRYAVTEKQPTVHLFGNVPHCHGVQFKGETLFINSCATNDRMNLAYNVQSFIMDCNSKKLYLGSLDKSTEEDREEAIQQSLQFLDDMPF